MTVLDEIKAEREKQIAKGYHAAHDDKHVDGEILEGAIIYAEHEENCKDRMNGSIYQQYGNDWPWDESSFKPKDHRTNLIKAAAMIVAEIERLDRQFVVRKRQKLPKQRYKDSMPFYDETV